VFCNENFVNLHLFTLFLGASWKIRMCKSINEEYKQNVNSSFPVKCPENIEETSIKE